MYPEDEIDSNQSKLIDTLILEFDNSYLIFIENLILQNYPTKRETLYRSVMKSFDEGRRDYQEHHFLYWMNSVVKIGAYSHARASELMGVDRTILSRRLKGTKKTSTADLGKFYVFLCNEIHEQVTGLLLPWKRLNLGGYIRALSILGKGFGMNSLESSSDKHSKEPASWISEEEIIMLIYYFSNVPHGWSPQKRKNNSVNILKLFDESVQYASTVVREPNVKTFEEWLVVIQDWGNAWLTVLYVLACIGNKHIMIDTNTIYPNNICEYYPVMFYCD